MVRLLATFFYLGRSPWIPGTVGTLGGIPLAMVFLCGGHTGYILATLLLTLVAIFVAQAFENKYDVHDSREIVIDEVAGYAVAMTWLPVTWQSFLFAFVIFRILDGLKPFPLSYIDRHIQGGLGVVADDILAGVITNFILQVMLVQTNWLGRL